jgi:hypothetical protein
MDNAPVSDSAETPRYVRLSLDIVLEVTDEAALRQAALDTVRGDEDLSDDERAEAVKAIETEAAESVSYLIDPFALVEDIPGTELVEAGWQSESEENGPDDEESYEDA